MKDKKTENAAKCECRKKTSIGGQALIEGIMMRGPEKTAMAVRNPSGDIILEVNPTAVKKHNRFLRLPIVRGAVNFIDSMILGYKCLMRSAEIAGLDEEAPKKDTPEIEENAVNVEESGVQRETTENATDTDKVTDESTEKAENPEKVEESEKNDEKKESSSSISPATMTIITIVSLVLGLFLALGLFVWLPSFVSSLALGEGATVNHPVLYCVIAGCLKVVILVAYMLLVSLMKDIRRTFMYHGAEHKTIFCYESGNELTVENVRRERRFHPRCGTSFLMLMVIVSIVIMIPISLLLNNILPESITSGATVGNKLLYSLIRTGVGIIMLPLMMGIGYELIKFCGRHDNILTKIISAPGLWLQRITVFEPDDSMIECAIAAFKEVIPEEEEKDKW